MPSITIVGSGFAGLTAIKTLRSTSHRIVGSRLALKLVSPRPEFVYYPGLIWVPSGRRTAEDLKLDLTPFFEKMGVEHIAAEAIGLRDGGRVLETTAGDVPNNGLILGTGGRFIRKLPGIEHAIIPCADIAAAEQIRDRLRAMEGGTIAMGFAGNPHEPNSMRGGPIFEFLFGIDSQLRAEGRRERFELVFFTPAERPGNRLGPKAVDKLLAEMRRRDIATHLGHKLKGFTADKVMTEGGEFPADLILFMPGLTGNQWFDNTALPRSPGGLVQADAHCRVTGFERVYVAGDSGSFPGPEWMPKQAHMADLQAEAAALNLMAELRGGAPTHTFKVELLCIVDAYDRGMLVGRTEKHNLVLPSLRLFHWLKHLFEWWYLRSYR
ncbi:FAD/NAD(P)-binding oxidoreductase [Thioalkalicoccus limnaeus]|uniref:FAD/NAD(P)-binding oxidoreductase n=1 Tax=Thioalkalicoccus limnaeus TaxID=120681 RepID=A0ABV4BF89_9GAMM